MFPPPKRTTVITNCEQEPIHLCGSIQPHGELIAFDPKSLVIEFVSANAGEIFDITPQALGSVLSADKLSDLRRNSREFKSKNLTVLESERTSSRDNSKLLDYLQHLDDLSRCTDLDDLLNRVAVAVHRLTYFQRVMIYRFEQDWSGTVVAEFVEDDYDSFLDLRFPAEDIPKQARDLYELNPIRYIPEVKYQPVDLLSRTKDSELDLSLSSLRGVSNIHLEYLRNMNVGASMSISIVVEGKLWGLIACHNKTALEVVPEVRQFCRSLSLLCSELISTRIASVQQSLKAEARTRQIELIELLSHHNEPLLGLIENEKKLLELTAAHGVAIWDGEQFVTMGGAPDISDLQKLVAHLEPSAPDKLLCTNEATTIFSNFSDDFLKDASGVLAVAVGKHPQRWLMFFRKELISEVTWAGEPTKSVDAENQRLHPRQSFKKWQEIVHGRSLDWTDAQQESAKVFGAYLQQRLDASEQLKAAIDAAQQAVLLVDQDEQVKYLNKRASALFERNHGSLVGKPLHALLPNGMFTKKLGSNISGSQSSELHVEVSATPIATPEGMFSFVSIADVSRKVALEQERNRLTAELKASNSTMQQFLDIIAHDLRAPILSIKNLAQWIEEDSVKNLDEQSQENLRTLQERAAKMSEQLTTLLDFSKAGMLRSEPERVDTKQLVQEIVASLPVLQDYKVEIGKLPTFLTVKPPLEHVLRNLLENAGKYGGGAGSRITVSSREQEDTYEFSITDEGAGIPAEFQNEIFFPLRKLSKSDPNSHGMGLAFVKKIVEQSGGKVSVLSNEWEGTTFSFSWKKNWADVVEDSSK